jgi:hypothetical protein
MHLLLLLQTTKELKEINSRMSNRLRLLDNKTAERMTSALSFVFFGTGNCTPALDVGLRGSIRFARGRAAKKQAGGAGPAGSRLTWW